MAAAEPEPVDEPFPPEPPADDVDALGPDDETAGEPDGATWFDLTSESTDDLPAEPGHLAEMFTGPRPVPDPPNTAEDLDADDLDDVVVDVPRVAGVAPEGALSAPAPLVEAELIDLLTEAESVELEAESEAAAAADPIARHDLAYLTPERIERAATTRRNHDAQIAALGPLALAAHQEDCPLCIARALPVAEPPEELVPRPGRVVLTLAEMLAAEIPTPPSRVAGLLPGEGFGIIAGPRKHGKTLTELQLALCVAGGVPFLGRAVTQCPVVIIEEEGAARALQDRLRGQAEALGVPADAPLHIAHRQRFRLDHPADVDAIDALIAGTGAGLVIIGPLAQVASIDENSNSSDGMGPIVRTMTGLAARHRALVNLVHHLRKPAGAPQAPKSVDEFFYRVRGADALVAGVDVALGLWREPEATEGTLYVLARDGENVRIPLLFDARTLTFSVNPEPDDPMAADVARFLEHLGERPGRWYTRAELEGATGWGKTKVLSVGMYAFGEGRAQQRTMARNAREWRVADASLGIVE